MVVYRVLKGTCTDLISLLFSLRDSRLSMCCAPIGSTVFLHFQNYFAKCSINCFFNSIFTFSNAIRLEEVSSVVNRVRVSSLSVELRRNVSQNV